MSCMAVMAVIVFVALFYFKAGYGYLSTSNWGPKISNKTAWVLMEAPAFLFLLYYTLRFALSGADTGNSKVVLYIMAGLYLLHYFQRSFIFPLLMRGKSKMPIAIMLMGLVFNTLNAYLIGGWLYSEAPAGMYGINWLPRKGLYRYVTSANYFGDFTEWPGYAILTWSPAGLLFAIWTFANLGPRAKSLTGKYEDEFGDEYRKLNKKHIIPFIW